MLDNQLVGGADVQVLRFSHKFCTTCHQHCATVGIDLDKGLGNQAGGTLQHHIAHRFDVEIARISIQIGIVAIDAAAGLEQHEGSRCEDRTRVERDVACCLGADARASRVLHGGASDAGTLRGVISLAVVGVEADLNCRQKTHVVLQDQVVARAKDDRTAGGLNRSVAEHP